MKRILFLLSILMLVTTTTAKETSPIRRESPHVITLFMKTIPTIDEGYEKQRVERVFSEPGKMARTIFKQKLNGKNPINRGVYSTYAGFVDMFNKNGQIIFPRKHKKDEITLIVGRKFRPVIIRGQTVEHFVRIKGAPVLYYKLTRVFNKDDNYYYWNTEKIDTPVSKKIPASAIIIFAKPQHITVPEGKSIAMKGENLLLPPIYPTKRISTDLNGISFLKINKYFKPVKFKTRRAIDRLGKIIRQ